MRFILSIIFLLICYNYGIAQTSTDTISEVRKKAKVSNDSQSIEELEFRYTKNKNKGFKRSNIEISLGKIYYNLGNTNTAIAIGKKALSNAQKADLYTVQVNAYNLLGNCYSFAKEHEQALACYMKADSINSATKKNIERKNRAQVNILTARKNAGLPISDAEIKELQELKQSTSLVTLWNHIELLLIRVEDLSVEEFMTRHARISRRVNPTSNLYTRRAVIEIEKEFYEKKKMFDKIPEIDARLVAFNEENLKDVNTESFDELDAKYVKEQQDREIQYLDEKNKIQRRFLIIGAAALFLISLLSYFLYRLLRRSRAQKEMIAKTLKEKDTLMREIHHRVKNNLQLVSSLLTMQGRSINDLNALEAINEGKSRVRSMALIHQDLYNRENLTGISVKEYIEKLTTELFGTYQVNQDQINLEMHIEDIELDVDTMVPLGLIINELISNSLKYAFPENRQGLLQVSLAIKDNNLRLQVTDDGIGYDVNKISEESFGSTLVKALTEQLDGKITTDGVNGATTTIDFLKYQRLL